MRFRHIYELNQQWWYRLLKAAYIIAITLFVVAPLVGSIITLFTSTYESGLLFWIALGCGLTLFLISRIFFYVVINEFWPNKY